MSNHFQIFQLILEKLIILQQPVVDNALIKIKNQTFTNIKFENIFAPFFIFIFNLIFFYYEFKLKKLF